jgi:hypothetical protein
MLLSIWLKTDPLSAVTRGLDPRVHPLRKKLFAKKMDARVNSAFTRVCRRAMPAHDDRVGQIVRDPL